MFTQKGINSNVLGEFKIQMDKKQTERNNYTNMLNGRGEIGKISEGIRETFTMFKLRLNIQQKTNVTRKEITSIREIL